MKVNRKLALNRETVRNLTSEEMSRAAGGATLGCPQPTTYSQLPAVCLFTVVCVRPNLSELLCG
jgi:natural product precursor